MDINKRGINNYILNKNKLKMLSDDNNHIVTELVIINNLLYQNLFEAK